MTTVVVAGTLANKPGNGGDAWVALSWLRGLAAAGFDVKFVEVIDPDFEDRRAGSAWFRDVVSSFELMGRAALWRDGKVVGATRTGVDRWLADADLLVDLSGHLANAEARGDGPAISSATTLFVDLDPGYTQVWHETGISVLGRHDHYASVGLLVGTPSCTAPDTGRPWIPAPPFVVLDDWPATERAHNSFTTVSTWTNSYGPLGWNGWKYGSKHHAFRKHRYVAALARSVDVELAIHFDDCDAADRDLLVGSGFRLADPGEVAATPAAFRRYVQSSAGEWSVAQGPYVGLRTGWLSDRTVRYLASGRPAVVQNTGLGEVVPVGEGLLVFDDTDEAAAALNTVADDWHHHSVAARDLAVRMFSAEAVLPRLLTACGVEHDLRARDGASVPELAV